MALSRLTLLATPDTVSDAFIAAITSAKQTPIARVDILEPTSKTVVASVEDDVDDGSVTVDVSRGNRRTFQIRLLNADGRYTPTATMTYFAFNSLVRVYRGFRYIDSRGGETDEFCLLGTFMVDRPEVFVERNMSVMTVDGSDRWKVIASGGFPGPTSPRTFAVGTHVNEIIREVAILSGLTDDELNLDQLNDRTNATKTLTTKLQWEIGDSRADFLKNLCDQFALDIFFDVSGLLTTRPTVDPTTVSPRWTFSPSEVGVMLGVTKVQSDLNLFNDIIVSGETSQGTFTGARAEKADTDPASPTSIYGTMGRRVFHYKAPLVYGNEQAALVAQKLYAEKCLVDEEIKLPTICLPHLDGNDVIAITEGTWSRVDDRYLAQRFDVPLREARQVIETKKGRAIS